MDLKTFTSPNQMGHYTLTADSISHGHMSDIPQSYNVQHRHFMLCQYIFLNCDTEIYLTIDIFWTDMNNSQWIYCILTLLYHHMKTFDIVTNVTLWYTCGTVIHRVPLYYIIWHCDSPCDIVIHHVTHHDTCDTPSDCIMVCHYWLTWLHGIIHYMTFELHA